MNAELSLNEILMQVQKLNKVEQSTLLKKIASMLKKQERQTAQVKLKDISGLGSEIWKGLDIDRYVNDERQW